MLLPTHLYLGKLFRQFDWSFLVGLVQIDQNDQKDSTLLSISFITWPALLTILIKVSIISRA